MGVGESVRSTVISEESEKNNFSEKKVWYLGSDLEVGKGTAPSQVWRKQFWGLVALAVVKTENHLKKKKNRHHVRIVSCFFI